MPESFIQLPADSTGRKVRSRQRTIGANTVEEQYFIPADDRVITGTFRASAFLTPGRAGTTGQKILALHNATGSTVIADVDKVTTDLYQTVIKAVTVPPPIIRLHRFTALPTGNVLAKVADDTTKPSNASLTAWQDASADRTSGTALAVTIPAGNMITQELAPRMITAAGYEMADRIEFLSSGLVTLRALEGIVLFLDYTVATSNPITDMWIASIYWDEYTLP